MPQSPDSSSTSPTSHRVLIATSYYEPAHLGGGPIQTLKALVHAAPERFEIGIICLNHDLGRIEPLVDRPNTWLSLGRTKVRYVGDGIRNLLTAFKTSRNVDILYLNSLFDLRFSIFPMLLWRLGFWNKANVLIAPRGQLDPGALSLKARKKLIFLQLFRLSRFPKAFIWHASSEIEARYIRESLGKAVRIIVRENETSLPPRATERQSREPGSARLVFASRLSEKKGLHILLEALHGLSKTVELEIIGAFEDFNYKKRCLHLVENLPEHISVTFHGGLPREVVLEHFHKADLFVFPTAGENFGHVIAEALSQSCPVMCSVNTPWSETLNNGGGIVVKSSDSREWKNALESFLAGNENLWEKASLQAGNSFNQWRNAPKGQHVFELTEAVLSTP